MRVHRIRGGGGLSLHISDQGPEDAPALVLIHGWAQSHISWQSLAPLAKTFRLVAFDLRGHGRSDAPEDAAAYTDSHLWAEDIAAIIKALNLSTPHLVGWSYGSRVIAAYLDRFGDADIAGVVLVSSLAAIGKAREDWMAAADSPGMNPDLYADDNLIRDAATRAFVEDSTCLPLANAEFTEAMIAASLPVSPLVRRALFHDSIDFRPIFARLNKPGLVIHGVEDKVVLPATGIALSECLKSGTLQLYEYTGHAPFLESPDRFNRDIADFCGHQIGAIA